MNKTSGEWTIRMGNVFYFPWEVSLIEWLQKTLEGAGTKAAEIFSAIGDTTATLLIVMVLVFCYSKEAGKRCGYTMMTAGIWFPMIKNIALRVRPYMAHSETIRAISLPQPDQDPMDILSQGFSFPSGHSAMAASLYCATAREVKKRRMWFLAFAMIILIGVSRFIVGVHYPTDVLAGWTVGFLAVAFLSFLRKKVQSETIRSLILLGMALPGIFWCSSHDYFAALGGLIGMTIVFPYEKKHVNFRDTRSLPVMILRVVGAMIVYLVLDKLLKLPFSREWMNGTTLGANLFRTARYAVTLFVLFGIYPYSFPLMDRLEKK